MNRLPVQLALAMLAGALQALALGSPLSDGLPLWWCSRESWRSWPPCWTGRWTLRPDRGVQANV